MSTSDTVSAALDKMFERPEGLYGAFDDLPVISRMGHERRMELLEQLNIGSPSSMKIADFGMGSWGFAAVYPRLHDCAAAIGMDISASAIEQSLRLIAESKPKYGPVFSALQSDGMDLPLPDSSIDLFFSGESIEHVKFPLKHLGEIYRVLKPDGQLVITTPNRDAIKYKEKSEEYCTSPEHFWLFNYEELIVAASRFFEVVEAYGFNGSFGSHEEDRSIMDEATAREWSQRFKDSPQLATGIVLRLIKRPGIRERYELIDVPKEDILINAPGTYLDLEFGLKGLLLDKPEQSVTISRPPSDGFVCRFWSHRWSGITYIHADKRRQEVDLYTNVPGWKNWTSDQRTITRSEITISPSQRKNAKSEAAQTLFFEAFGWNVVNTPIPLTPAQPLKTTPTSMAGYGFDKFQPIVSTTVFHWFSPNEGNVRGPWQPIEGRKNWTGECEFWRTQIKQIMLANIDSIYLHCIDLYEDARCEFFKAYAELRREGFDVPKIAPFLDPNILFGQPGRSPIDVETDAGKDAFTNHYVRFFDQYFAENRDDDAASFLLTIDGKLTLATWWVYSLLHNLHTLTREDVERRLSIAFGAKIPQLRSGIHMVTTALIDPDLSFSDERIIAFSGYAYAIHCVHHGIDSWHVQPGYWDQNIRKPGYLLPRGGGKNYRSAWDAVIAAAPHLHRVYVESWNEYDEGSGIYAADPAAPWTDPAMNSGVDSFSDDGDPFEYILTTNRGASKINGRPAWDCKFLWHDMPALAKPGQSMQISVTVRNLGNTRWATGEDIALVLRGEGGAELSRVHPCEGVEDHWPHGVYRGGAVEVKFMAVATRRTGRSQFTVELLHGEHRIGKAMHLSVDVIS
ncbi:methyltransferase domain-containing protein [Variovorax sp. J22R133]|uniref:methyltransferase domain-containing protein n=1 Tax=Variovorax brevis TaxID=3053503 RepID=UPI002576670F|nr:methyltransferase domain-containing protein [Variovorax sp. J22R133]MDM0114695.1 methyltransferase domain-containing protein [Variovorax sp. J22R133]